MTTAGKTILLFTVAIYIGFFAAMILVKPNKTSQTEKTVRHVCKITNANYELEEGTIILDCLER